MTLTGRRVVLGVSGGIACYKACTVARRLAETGAAVHVVLTASARRFVGPVSFEGLTGRPVLSSLWERDRALAHIRLARDPDLVIVAPATAHLLARAAQGLADDLLPALLLATRKPVLAAPAMNDDMVAHPATRAHLETLRERGWTILGPAVGPLAEGPSDRPGRMVEPEEIVAHAVRMLRAPGSALRNRVVVVTAGPTREYIDAVRVLTNPSSGRMGYALAGAAFARGARVILVTGPTALPPPIGPDVRRVETTEQMRATVERVLPEADVLIMAAAPADFRPACPPGAGKRPRAAGRFELPLEPTVDVLEETRGARRPGAVMVGFALEHGPDGVARARAKLDRKSLDLVVLNHVGEAGAGFETETNRVTLVERDGVREVERMPKEAVAEVVLDEIETRL